MQEKITFRADAYEIEGRLSRASGPRGVVISHPHPAYGGSMHNRVVVTIQRMFAEFGFTTLRFNFRGVGNSQGHYDRGIGEQTDVRQAIGYLENLEIRDLYLAGYSFGTWVNAKVGCLADTLAGMVMVSPPAAFMAFDSALPLRCLRLIVTGGRDEFAPADRIRPLHAQWNPAARFEVIPQADHFYSGCHDQLAERLSRWLGDLDGAPHAS
jgi:alpha/beta superfamily hydrolase